jgi:UDP-3-O-[3-hydroxymyristoyl] N-acetylglucosamine deacetylase
MLFSIYQHTVGRQVTCSGVGLHTGARVQVTLVPAPEDTGIVFVRTDINDGRRAEVRAHVSRVVDTNLGTTLANSYGVKVATVEHLMSALAGCGIDNVRVMLSGPEVPIMDGSAEPFVFLVECAGLAEQSAPRRYLKVRETVEVRDGAGWMRLSPAADFHVSLEIDFDNPLVSQQSKHYNFGQTSFKNTVSRARTFGFAEEVSHLRSMGLALGGSLDNAIIVDRDTVLNHGGLRYQDEFVRHKILDCVGDLYLAGTQVIGHVEGHRSGHGLNAALLRELFRRDAYDLVYATSIAGVPTAAEVEMAAA